VGFVEASDRDAASAILASHDLFVLSVVAQRAPNALDNLAGVFNRVRRKDLVVFTRQLATLLEARLPLNNALKILFEQTTNTTLKTAISQVTEDIDSGISFSQAMERQGKTFPDYYVEMIRAAEVTGNLNEVATFLADYTEKEGDLAGKAASALIYPASWWGFLWSSRSSCSRSSIRRSAASLRRTASLCRGTPRYFSTRDVPEQVVGRGHHHRGRAHGRCINYFQTQEGTALLDEMKIRLPIVKKVYSPVIMARFGNSAALLVHGGIPIAQALEIIGHMLGNSLYRDIVHDVAEMCGRDRCFRRVSTNIRSSSSARGQMVAVGETTERSKRCSAAFPASIPARRTRSRTIWWTSSSRRS